MQVWSWRPGFLINLPIAVVCVWLARKYVPESRDETVTGRIDVTGSVLGAVGLTAALVEAPVMFADRTFTLSNGLTFVVYAALGDVMMLLVLQLQVSLGYSPTAAGLAGLPITIIMLLLSGRSARSRSASGRERSWSSGRAWWRRACCC